MVEPRASVRDVQPVIVVGAGPVGLGATLELARFGVRSILITQRHRSVLGIASSSIPWQSKLSVTSPSGVSALSVISSCLKIADIGAVSLATTQLYSACQTIWRHLLNHVHNVNLKQFSPCSIKGHRF